VRQIGDDQQKILQAGVELGDALVVLADAVGDGFHFSDDRSGVLPGFFETGNLLAGFVALSFARLDAGDELAPLAVELDEFGEI